MITSQDEERSDSSSWTSLEDQICQRCRRIDLTKAFTTSMPASVRVSNGILLTSEAFELNELDWQHCDLCRNIDFSTSNWDDPLPRYWQLRAYPPPSAFTSSQIEWATNLAAAGTVWLQAVPFDHLPAKQSMSLVASRAVGTGWTACYNSTLGPEMFVPRQISPVFSAHLARKWLDSCKTIHSKLCNAPSVVPRLTLIDCATLRLCYAQNQPRYVALSYVWGVKRSKENVSAQAETSEAQSLPPLDNLPQVIKDAITVTKELGFRYLWVDKYCISKDDAMIQTELIDNMGLIYYGAELTIIAAAGEDEEHGLAGVGLERDHDLAYELGPCAVMQIPSHLNTVRWSSKWATRGWTFQEEICSRRRLYFSARQVYFLCNEMECWEAIGGIELANDTEAMHYYSIITAEPDNIEGNVGELQILHRIINRHLDTAQMEDKEEHFRNVLGLSGKYSARELTYDRDSIRAFVGVEKFFQQGGLSLFNIQGLPLLYLENSSPEDKLKQFTLALGWEHCEPGKARQRPTFPSWTTAGWTTRISHLGEIETFRSLQMHPRSISFEYEDRSVASFDDVWDYATRMSSRSAQDDYNGTTTARFKNNFMSPISVLCIAAVLPLGFFSFADHRKWKTGNVLNMHFLTITRAWGIDSVPPFSPLYFLNGLSTGALGCLLLGINKGILPRETYRAHLLLVQWCSSGECRRIGKVTAVTEDEMDKSSRQQVKALEWKNVKLV